MKYFGWIFLFFIVVFIVPLSSRPMLEPEEFIQAEIAREMIASGNYTLPTVDGEVLADRLPMSSWLISGSFKLFGCNAFALRLPFALAVGLTALLIAWFIHQAMRDVKLAALSSLIYMTFALTLFAGGASRYPARFTMFAAGALGMLFLASREEKFNRRKFLLLVLGGFSAGAAFLTCGLAGILLPVVIFLLYLIFNHRYKDVLIISLPALISAAVPVVPYLLRAEQLQAGFCQEFFAWSNFTAGIGSSASWYCYLLCFALGTFPGVILMPAAAMAGKEAWQKLFRQPLCRFAILSVIVPPVYMAVMRNGMPEIVLLSFPALAILTAMGLQAYFNAGGHHRSFDWMLNVWALFLLITGILEIVFWFMQGSVFREYFSVLPISELFLLNLGIASIIGGGVVLYSLRGTWRSRLYLFFFSISILPLGISWCFESSSRMPEATFRKLIGAMDVVMNKSVFVTSSEFYPAVSWSVDGGSVVSMDKRELEKIHAPGKSVCVILRSDDPAWKELPAPAKIVAEGEFSCAVFYDCVICQAENCKAE
jgi:4-amino-4-deoxy-L-arabinose transferase